MSYIQKLDNHEVDMLRELLLGDFKKFSEFCFRVLTGTKLVYVDYYEVLFVAIQEMINQESPRMIINIPPRAGKTLIVSQLLPLYAWCINPCAQTILTGFNTDVLAESAGYIRAIMSDPDFERVFPDVVLDKNKKSVEKLGTMSAGVLHAIPPTGKMTGKGAGTLVKDSFSGIFCIDDYIKPDDAQSPTERNKSNGRYGNVLLSRLATEETPLCIIMQRLHADDLCGYLMKGGDGTTYRWLNIPGIITKETGSKAYYDKEIEKFGYTHVDPVYYDLKRPDDMFDELGESSFWAARKSLKTLQLMRDKDPYTFYSQYMGSPIGKGKITLQRGDISTYEEYDWNRLQYTFMTADTAATTKTYSDYSVAVLWGFSFDGKLILLDAMVGKYTVPNLIRNMRKFWNKHNVWNPNLPNCKPTALYMEDKSSGLFLNQQFMEDGTVDVEPVPRDGTASNDKFSRFLNTIPYFKSGDILIPKNHEHSQHILLELVGQSEYGSNTGHDDVADNVSDAVVVAFADSQMNYENWA